MMIGQAFIRWSLICDSSGLGHKLGQWQTAETFDNMFYYCAALLMHTFSHFV